MNKLYKKEGKEMSKENQESFPKVSINCLPCIYTVHQQKLIKWDFLVNEILQVLMK